MWREKEICIAGFFKEHKQQMYLGKKFTVYIKRPKESQTSELKILNCRGKSILTNDVNYELTH